MVATNYPIQTHLALASAKYLKLNLFITPYIKLAAVQCTYQQIVNSFRKFSKEPGRAEYWQIEFFLSVISYSILRYHKMTISFQHQDYQTSN